MGKITTLASGKGGVGKTVVTAALGAALAQIGKRVLLLDGDMGLRDLDMVVGQADQVLFDIFDVATGRCFESDAILSVAPGLDLLPASQRYRWEDISGAAVLTVLEDLRSRYDYLLIDSPAGIGAGLTYTLDMADDILLVVEPTWVSVRDTDRVMRYLHEQKMFDYGLLLNRFYPPKTPHYLSVTEVVEHMQPEWLVGVLPYAPEMVGAAQCGEVAQAPQWPRFGEMLRTMAMHVDEHTESPVSDWERWLTAFAQEGGGRLAQRRERSRPWRMRGRW